MNLGVYCETLSPAALAAPDVLRLLGDHRVALGLAVPFAGADGRFDPAQFFPALALGEKLRRAGAHLAVWPLLPKPLGYWINERNLDAADRLIDALLEACRRFGDRPDLVVFDVETPWPQMEILMFPGLAAWRRVLSGARRLVENRNPRRYAWSCARLGEIVARVRGAGIAASVAAFALLIADLVNDGDFLQDLLEMPVFRPSFDGYNAMIYNSYLPAAAPWLVPPTGAPRFAYEYARELVGRFGARAWATLGSTWEGVLPGNEGKIFRHAADLAPDVAAVKAAGVDTIWLYCLEGVLFRDQQLTERRPPAETETFFRVLAETPARTPAPHAGWTRGRRRLESLARDRLKRFYGRPAPGREREW
jgi:hypothetical protein